MSFFVPFYAAFYISEKEKYISIYKSGHDKWSAFVVRKMANFLIYRFFQVLSLNLTLSDKIIILDKLYK